MTMLNDEIENNSSNKHKNNLIGYYSIENILKPNFGKRSKTNNDSSLTTSVTLPELAIVSKISLKQSCNNTVDNHTTQKGIGNYLSTQKFEQIIDPKTSLMTKSSIKLRNSSPLKNSIKFYEKFFRLLDQVDYDDNELNPMNKSKSFQQHIMSREIKKTQQNIIISEAQKSSHEISSIISLPKDDYLGLTSNNNLLSTTTRLPNVKQYSSTTDSSYPPNSNKTQDNLKIAPETDIFPKKVLNVTGITVCESSNVQDIQITSPQDLSRPVTISSEPNPTRKIKSSNVSSKKDKALSSSSTSPTVKKTSKRGNTTTVNTKNGNHRNNSSNTRPFIPPPNPMPAWIFCTRYSDRPSSGIRSKRRKKQPSYDKTINSKVSWKRGLSNGTSSPCKSTDQERENSISDQNVQTFRSYKDTDLLHGKDVVPKPSNANNNESFEMTLEGDYVSDDQFLGIDIVNGIKRPRTAFSHSQLHKLRREFQQNPYLTETRRKSLADELGLNESQIKIWFQNKRAKLKKKALKIKGGNNHYPDRLQVHPRFSTTFSINEERSPPTQFSEKVVEKQNYNNKDEVEPSSNNELKDFNRIASSEISFKVVDVNEDCYEFDDSTKSNNNDPSPIEFGKINPLSELRLSEQINCLSKDESKSFKNPLDQSQEKTTDQENSHDRYDFTQIFNAKNPGADKMLSVLPTVTNCYPSHNQFFCMFPVLGLPVFSQILPITCHPSNHLNRTPTTFFPIHTTSNKITYHQQHYHPRLLNQYRLNQNTST